MILAIVLFGACSAEDSTRMLPEAHVQMTSGSIYAEVQVPAGYSPLDVDQSFLPFPANKGIVRLANEESVAKLPTLILCDALAPGSTIEIHPVAMVRLDSLGTSVDIIISVPVDTALRTLQIDGFVDLLTEHEPVRHILQTWLVNYRGFGAFVLKGWHDEKAAIRRIHQNTTD